MWGRGKRRKRNGKGTFTQGGAGSFIVSGLMINLLIPISERGDLK